jgi:hypothetical protein
MKKVRFVVLASALAGLLFGGWAGGEAQAQEKQVRSESAQEAQQRVSKERQVSGTVLGIKDVEFKGSDQKNTVALLRTNKNNRRLVVDLGPKKDLKELNVKKGQQLAAKGVVVNVGDQPLLVASQLKRGNKTLDVDRMPQIEALRKQQGPEGTQQQPGMQSPQPGMQSPQQQRQQGKQRTQQKIEQQRQQGTQRTQQEVEQQQQRMQEQQQQLQRRQQELERREQQMEEDLQQEGEQLIE